jgi:hypothetical protein
LEALSLLIGQVYDAAVDPALWPSVLLQTCMFAGAERAILIHEDALEPRDSMFHISSPDPDWYQLYVRYRDVAALCLRETSLASPAPTSGWRSSTT